jgi:Uma2 family endonuclease
MLGSAQEEPVAEPARARMTADAFIAWAMEQPQGRWELDAGEIVAMAPERSGHALVKAEAWRALSDGVRRAGLRCQAYPDGMAVVVDASTVYEPDASVRCGEPLRPEAVRFSDPVIVVEVVSPSSRSLDATRKLVGYFSLPSVRHYLLIDLHSRAVIHHGRDAEDDIRTRILREGALRLEPPGLSLEIGDLFATL